MNWAKPSKLRKAAMIAGIVLVAGFLTGYLIYLHARDDVEEYRKQLRAAGEKLSVDELIPPRIPAEQNGAELLRQAAKVANFSETFFYSNPPPAMRLVAPGKAMIGWKQPDIRGSEATNSWDEADALCRHFSIALNLLRQAAAHPALNFEIDYQRGFQDLQLPQLDEMRRAAQVMSAASICDLHRGESASAVTNAHALLVLLERWKSDPLAISQLVRIALAQLALNLSWELLQSPDVNEKQLEMLQADWDDLQFVQAADQALSMERAMGEVTLANTRGSNSPLEVLTYYPGGSSSGASTGDWLEDLKDRSKSVWRETKLKSKETLWRVSWSYTDELRMLQGEQALLDAMRRARTNASFKDALAELKIKLTQFGFPAESAAGSLNFLDWYAEDPADIDVRWILSSSVVSLKSAINKVLLAEATKALAVTATALKRYRLRYGSYPTELSALVPEFLPSVRRDPVDGQPLRYHLNSDGTFLLYSIGEDGVDDGGDARSVKDPASHSWQRGRDWVWPQPATTKEIQDYENGLALRKY